MHAPMQMRAFLHMPKVLILRGYVATPKMMCNIAQNGLVLALLH
jgi:hypothetical protein